MPSVLSSHWHPVITVYCHHSIRLLNWGLQLFGMFCGVPTAEEFLMGWNIRLANEHSELRRCLGESENELKSYSFVLNPQLHHNMAASLIYQYIPVCVYSKVHNIMYIAVYMCTRVCTCMHVRICLYTHVQVALYCSYTF